jgi:hypothetical protein
MVRSTIHRLGRTQILRPDQSVDDLGSMYGNTRAKVLWGRTLIVASAKSLVRNGCNPNIVASSKMPPSRSWM